MKIFHDCVKKDSKKEMRSRPMHGSTANRVKVKRLRKKLFHVGFSSIFTVELKQR